MTRCLIYGAGPSFYRLIQFDEGSALDSRTIALLRLAEAGDVSSNEAGVVAVFRVTAWMAATVRQPNVTAWLSHRAWAQSARPQIALEDELVLCVYGKFRIIVTSLFIESFFSRVKFFLSFSSPSFYLYLLFSYNPLLRSWCGHG